MARNASFASAINFSKSSPVLTTPLTLAAWVNFNSVTNDQSPIAITASGASGWQNMWNIQMPGSTATKVFWAETGQTNSFTHSAEAGANVVAGVWYLMVGVFTTSTNRLVYRNATAGTSDPTLKTPTSPSLAWLGGAVSVNLFRGSIAFPALWNIDLNANDIAMLASGRHPRRVRSANLVGVLNFSGPLPSAEPDLVASAWTIAGAASIADAINPRIYP